MNLILYFSAEKGKMAKIAKDLTECLREQEHSHSQEVAVVEIKPEIPYSSADLRYINPLVHCNKEKLLNNDIPLSSETKKQLNNLDWNSYDTIYLGFPIWYGSAPNIEKSFCKPLDWTGKKVHIFATSMTSWICKTAEKLKPFLKCYGNIAEIVSATRVMTVKEMSI